ncbi:MAG TPA: phosphate ABC transporter ATP-binding protein PstB [Acidimicrobiales bacterium]|jgi:phosphate transport system ATP-binding protein|nr:phosphate ABC transporter ATP-binding protein PstB [Acidimicrobiales bacterium]
MIDPATPVPPSSLGGLNVNTAEVLVDKPVGEPAMQLQDVTVAFAGRKAVRNVSFDAHEGEITALIGPSGSGKTTLLRALNRMHDTVRSASVTGSVKLGPTDVYANSTDATLLRSRVGMVFQRPNPFPTMSIYENTVAGLKFNGVRKKALLDEAAESALIAAALWDSVRDRLKAHASTLSGGEQQRLCIARALAVEPEVLLMDEPTSALDPIATKRIEELVGELKHRVTIIIVTHNMQQAMRVSDRCAFLLMAEDKAGELIEFGPTARLFSEPSDPRTLDYVNGRFG